MRYLRYGARAVALFVACTLLAGLLAVTALAVPVTDQVVFTKIELIVKKGAGNHTYAEYTYKTGAFVMTAQPPLGLKINEGDELLYRVYWEMPAANIAAAKAANSGTLNGATISIPVHGGGHLTFPNKNPVDLVDGNGDMDGDQGIIGTWGISSSTINVTFNANANKRTTLENGYFSVWGAAVSQGNDIQVSFGGHLLGGITVEPPSGGAAPGPTGPFDPVQKSAWQPDRNKPKVQWSLAVNQNSMEQFFKNQTDPPGTSLTPYDNVVLVDELKGGQTITADDVGLQMVVHIPFYNASNTADPNNGRLLNTSLGYLSITSQFTRVNGASYATLADFKTAVKAAAPAFGVFGGNTVVIGFGALNGGTSSVASLNAKTIIDTATNGGGITQLITNYDNIATYPDLNQKQKDIITNTYYNDSNAIGGGVINLRVLLTADASAVPEGTLNNEATVEHDGGTIGQGTASLAYYNADGGVQGTRQGRVTLTKRDLHTGALLEGVGFELQQWDGTHYVPYAATPAQTGPGGVVEFTGLPNGRYKIVETAPLAGYSAQAVYTPSDEFEINHASGAIHITLSATNQRIPGSEEPGGSSPDALHAGGGPTPGDEATPFVWAGAGLLFLLGFAGLATARRRGRKRDSR